LFSHDFNSLIGPCLETELLEGLRNDIKYGLMNWSAGRVEINLLAIKFCGTKYGTCSSFLGKVWSPCASKVDDLNIAASETVSDLSVQQATQFWRIFNFGVFVRMLTTVIHARFPCGSTSMSAFLFIYLFFIRM
jgi:hypothetical protein